MAEDNWFYAVAGQQHGPVPLETLRELAASGTLRGDDLVWTDGMPEWSPASSVEALGAAAASPALPVHAVPAGPPDPAAATGAPADAPYATPAGVLGYGTYAYHPHGVQFEYAGFWIRFVATFIDGIITWLAGVIVEFVVGALIGLMAGSASQNTLGLVTVSLGLVANLVIGWLYEAMFTASRHQATPGKMAVGLRVTDLEGNRISFARATGRHFAKWLSSLILGIGYIMAAFHERKQALHDQIVGTIVTYKR